jgi:hypothetical protein
LPPLQALRSIHVIEGKPTLSADLMAVLARRAGVRIRIIETTDTRCTIEATRPGSGEEPVSVTWTAEDAKRAGLDRKNNWRQYPRQMLRARCMAEVCRLAAGEALLGLAAPEEIEEQATAQATARNEEETR